MHQEHTDPWTCDCPCLFCVMSKAVHQHAELYCDCCSPLAWAARELLNKADAAWRFHDEDFGPTLSWVLSHAKMREEQS